MSGGTTPQCNLLTPVQIRYLLRDINQGIIDYPSPLQTQFSRWLEKYQENFPPNSLCDRGNGP